MDKGRVLREVGDADRKNRTGSVALSPYGRPQFDPDIGILVFIGRLPKSPTCSRFRRFLPRTEYILGEQISVAIDVCSAGLA